MTEQRAPAPPAKMRRLQIGAGLLAAALLVASTLAAVRAWRSDHLLRRGRALVSVDEKEGEKLLSASLQLGSEDAAVELAQRSFSRRDWPAVHRYADQALKINPFQGYVHILKSFALAEERMPATKAAALPIITECRAGLAVEPADGGLWESCTELSLRIFRHLFPSGHETPDSARLRADALDMYRRALVLNEREASRFVTAMADLVPDGSFLVQGLEGPATQAARATVGLLLDRDEWKSVSAEYWNMAVHSGNRRGMYLAAVENLRRRKRYREAFTALKRYRYIGKEDAHLAYLAALCAEALGPDSEEWSAAEEYYRTALKLDGERPDYRRRMGMHLARKGSHDAAEPLLLEAALADPRDHRSRYYLGLIADARGDEERALDYYREAFDLQPDSRHYRTLVEKGGQER